MSSIHDQNRLKKIASNMSEEERRKNLDKADEVRRDIDETLGYDIVKQDKLEKIAEAIWLNVPMNQRAKYTATDWQNAIHNRCMPAINMAETKLQENQSDERLYVAKVRILRNAFSRQVNKAMYNVAEKYKK